MKKYLKAAVFTAVLLLPGLILALGGGTSNADFLKIGVGARPAAMGDAYAAVSDDPNACFWNPAGITSIDKWSFTGMYLAWFLNSNYEFAAVVMPIDNMTNAGLSINMLNIPGFDSTGGLDTPAPASYDLAVTLTLARNLGNLYTKDFTIGNISLGANLTYIKRSLTGIDLGSQFSADFGLIANITDFMKFGIVMQDIGASLGEDPSPFNIKAGGSWNIDISKDFSMLIAADLNKPVDVTNPEFQRWYFGIGTELRLTNYAFIRAGYKFGQEYQGLTAGCGFAIPGMGSLDYAFMPHTELGNTHRASLSFKFGNQIQRPLVGSPQPPQKVTAISGDKVVSIGWDPNPEGNIIGYNIYFKEKTDKKYAKLNKEPILEESKFKALLNNDVTYSFVVTAINNRNLESVYSSSTEATPKKYEVLKPSQVQGVIAKVDGTNIVVTWNLNKEDFVIGYNLYYKKDGDAKYKRLNQKILREATATLGGLTAKVRYFFTVTALTKDGMESDFSEVNSAQIDAEEYY